MAHQARGTDDAASDRSFWGTATGLFTALAAFLGAVTAAVTLYTTVWGDDDDGPKRPAETTAVTDPNPTAVPSTRQSRAFRQWVDEANAECRTTSPKVVDIMGTLNASQDPTSPDFRNGLLQLSLAMADLQSRLQSLPLPTEQESTVTTFLARYGERTQQAVLAAERIQVGDVRGAGAALVAFSDIGTRLEPLLGQMGLAACP